MSTRTGLAITSFTASPATVTLGHSTTLTWTLTGDPAYAVLSIDDQAVAYLRSGTSKVVTPSQTATYTLTVWNANRESVTAQVLVTVVPFPTIVSFTASPPVINAGASASLKAVFADGDGAINNGIGKVNSSVEVGTGDLRASTTYTLTVTNPASDSSTAQVVVTVVPAAGLFTATASMNAGRDHHTATLLLDGRVLVAGEYSSVTSELYDAASGTFTATMTAARQWHTATLLPNGKVLIAGGHGDHGDFLSSAELYDPESRTFVATGTMTTARTGHTATLLENGKVLIAGGSVADLKFLASAELYDPHSGTFAATGAMTTAREWHTATLLPSGKVLVAGGNNVVVVSNSDLYDPASETFTATGALATARHNHTATLLQSGKALVVGGNQDAAYFSSSELYDPASGSFTSTGAMTAPRYWHTATLLDSGKVLIAGGTAYVEVFSSAELYDPASGTFTTTGTMIAARHSHTATLLQNGKVLVAGGDNNAAGLLMSAEIYY
jgi:hypothetical protein